MTKKNLNSLYYGDMKTILFLIFFSSILWAALLGHSPEKIVFIKGNLILSDDGIDFIESDFRKVKVRHESLVKTNKVDLSDLKRRKIFKVKLGDILDVLPKKG